MMILLTVLLAIAQTGPPAPGRATNSSASARQSVNDKPAGNQKPPTKPLPPFNPSTANPQQKPSNARQPKNEPQTVRVTEFPAVSVSRDWAEWVLWGFNGALVIVGFLGIRLAYKTLLAIEKQTKATEDAATATQIAAEATKESADTAKKAVDLQRVAMDQWIDTDDWKAGPRFIQPTATEAFIPIKFTVVNNTNFKMFLDRVTVWIDREEAVSIWYRGKLLTPNGGEQPVTIERRLMGIKLESYRKGVYRFEIGGIAFYIDAFGDKQEERFGFHCSCQMSSHAEFEPISFYPPDAAELEAQKQRKAQTQQDNPN